MDYATIAEHLDIKNVSITEEISMVGTVFRGNLFLTRSDIKGNIKFGLYSQVAGELLIMDVYAGGIWTGKLVASDRVISSFGRALATT